MDDLLTAPAEVWCCKCDQPSVVEVEGEAYCGPHVAALARRKAREGSPLAVEYRIEERRNEERARYVPDAITDPWLRAQYAQATRRTAR